MVNALAFSGSNYPFSMLRSSDLNEERKRYDQAVEQLRAAQAKWSRKRTEHLDWISEDLRRLGHAVQTFRDVDDAMREKYRGSPEQYLTPVGGGRLRVFSKGSEAAKTHRRKARDCSKCLQFGLTAFYLAPSRYSNSVISFQHKEATDPGICPVIMLRAQVVRLLRAEQ